MFERIVLFVLVKVPLTSVSLALADHAGGETPLREADYVRNSEVKLKLSCQECTGCGQALSLTSSIGRPSLVRRGSLASPESSFAGIGLMFVGLGAAHRLLSAMTKQKMPVMNNIPIAKNRNPLPIPFPPMVRRMTFVR